MNYVYFTATLEAATWGAELASGDAPAESTLSSRQARSNTTPMSPTRLPGNPTQSFRIREPLRVVEKAPRQIDAVGGYGR
jgi:rifampin ADP-ribosylating transferase